jgi:tetratricopeptide (TPR) repeat protein
MVQQEFATAAPTFCYAHTAVNLISLMVVFIAKKGQWAPRFIDWYISFVEHARKADPERIGSMGEKQIQELHQNKELLALGLLYIIVFPILVAFVLLAIRVAFRLSWLRTIVVAMAGFLAIGILGNLILMPLGFILASPLLLVIGFFVLQGYWREVARRRQAQIDFEQGLERATLNPADSSAHYNLGLLYQQRGDLESARKSFEKAVEIDREEIDAHYQLGRIARARNRLQEAINNFGEVVLRNESHAQSEIWREVGATYFAAGQYADAKDALEKFLATRTNDPEGLYLMGRTQAGLGDKRAAAAALQACIQAVKTAPSYKYRLEKHWLNEAEKFLKSLQANA